MNINNYAPKHVILADVKAKAKDYKGTFSELLELIQNKTVTLVTKADGTVTGIWVNSGENNPMLDQLAGENFNRAYCCKPVSRWTEIIVDAIYSHKNITDVDDEKGTCKIDDSEVVFEYHNTDDSHHNYNENSNLLTSIDIVDGDEFDNPESLKEIRSYLKRTYGHCLAKGTQPKIEYDADTNVIHIDDIRWGRKLSPSELRALELE